MPLSASEHDLPPRQILLGDNSTWLADRQISLKRRSDMGWVIHLWRYFTANTIW